MYESEDFRAYLESDLEYIVSFGLKDDVVRDHTVKPIKDLRNDSDSNQKGTAKVRIVTGDMLETAKAVALDVGIINNEEDEE